MEDQRKYNSISILELPDLVLDNIFQHLNAKEVINCLLVCPERFNSIANYYFRHNCAQFKISYMEMRKFLKSQERDIKTMVNTVEIMLRHFGRYIWDLTVHYNIGGSEASETISHSIRLHCSHLSRLHVSDVSMHLSAGADIAIPRLHGLKSFVFSDSDLSSNKDDIISEYFTDCALSLETLCISHTCLNGKCLMKLKSLKQLGLHSNYIMHSSHGDGDDYLLSLYIADLWDNCHNLKIQQLVLQQEDVMLDDLASIFVLSELTNVSIVVDHSTDVNMNRLLKGFIKRNTCEHLWLIGLSNNKYQIQLNTLSELENFTKLQTIQLGGVVKDNHLINKLEQMKKKGMLDEYSVY